VKTKNRAEQSTESNSAVSTDDLLKPMFVTDEQAAIVTGLTTHQLYLYRRRGGGPPFVQHGARVRYPIDGLKTWSAELPRFSSRAEAYAANPQRALAASKQGVAIAQARETRHEPKPEPKMRKPKGASVTADERAS
jgi:hypothetical protein